MYVAELRPVLIFKGDMGHTLVPKLAFSGLLANASRPVVALLYTFLSNRLHSACTL